MKGLRWFGIGALVLAVFAALLLTLADTGFGHRIIAARIAALAPKSGLRIAVARIDGSIYGKAQIKGLVLSDPQGSFFEAPDVALDWSPTAWLNNRLDITSALAPSALLHRLPKLRPSDTKRPLLPNFDIRVGQIAIQKLRIGAAITGGERTGSLRGKADIRAGRALVKLDVDAAEGDVLHLGLDAAPDRDQFDLEANLSAPAGGVFGAMLGTTKPAALQITGDGSWRQWQGQMHASLAGIKIFDLALRAQRGLYGVDGKIMLDTVVGGKLKILSAPMLRVAGDATLSNRLLVGDLRLSTQALQLRAKGGVDLARNQFNGLLVNARLVQPAALFPNMTGSDVALNMRLNGAFAAVNFDYLLTAPFVAFDKTRFDTVRASGQGRFGESPQTVPIKLTAQRVLGVGDVAGGLLNNLSVSGPLLVTTKSIVGDGLSFTSDKLSGKLSLFVDLITGRYDVGIAGQLVRYLIPGLGIVDVKTELKVIPGENGKGSRISGRGQAWVRRFDNPFLAGLAQGLPVLDTSLSRDGDGVIHFTNLKLTAPGISLSGTGLRRVDGSFVFDGSGRQARYGPLKLALDGRIERPKLTLIFASPGAALGLSQVRLLLDPDLSGYIWQAAGGSTLGPFTGRGGIALGAGRTSIRVDQLNASGLKASGTLVSLPGGFSGQMMLGGSGVSGTLDFNPSAQAQQIEAHIKARDARLEGPPLLIARRGQFDGVIRLAASGTEIDGTVTGQGLARGGITLARLAANMKLKGGSGEIRASFAGSRGRSFDFQTIAQIATNRIEMIGSGSVDRKPIRFNSPAILTREAGGWRLAQTALVFGGGQAKVSGLFGGPLLEVDATVEQMPLTILDIFYPRLNLGGIASGAVLLRQPNGGAPTGSANLGIKGLTRSGLVLSSRPVDVGLNAILSSSNAAARVVAVSGGQIIGRGQIKLTPTGGGSLTARLENAPIFAQLRFNGAADTLWRLTGIEGFDVSGPVAIGADIRGTLNAPLIQGSVRTAAARVENPVTGMILSNVKAIGRFDGSRLVIDNFAGAAGSGGSVSGAGSFDLSTKSGVGMNLTLNADHAVLIARDDLAATVTGPLTLVSDGNGGLISGNLELNKSLFRLGRATAAGAVPRLNVREINGIASESTAREPTRPWRLALTAKAENRLTVTGLGIESEWRADLDVGGTITNPTMKGRADLIRGGYEFAGRRFDLTRGSIRFQGENPPDPIIDIAASGDTQGLNATIRVTGTGQKPEIAFSSVPALPQDELLSRLLFGTSITNLSAPEALQLAAAVAALQSGNPGLNPINLLRNAIGLDRLRILPADSVTGQKTSIAVGKYLTRRTYVELITDGQGYSATRIEFQITRWLSLLSSISTIGRQSATVRVSKDY